ncbi:MAG: polysaccharide biosynthesis protein [Clostridiaceae bacterium]
MTLKSNWRIFVLILIDIVLINLAYLSALYFRFENAIPNKYIDIYYSSIFFIIGIYLISFYFCKLYESLWTYASIDEFLLSIGGCIIPSFFLLMYNTIFQVKIPYTIIVLSNILTIIYVVGFRLSFRIFRRIYLALNHRNRSDSKQVLVIGAGSAGSMIIREMKRYNNRRYIPVALIDDSKTKIGTSICRVKVLGNRNSIARVVKEKAVDEIVIAIPSLQYNDKKNIINICKSTGCKVKIVPGIEKLIDGNVSLNNIKDVDVEDLLGRETIKLDNEGIERYIKNKTVLVTGGGGSIGSELCRQIARYNPKQLLIFDIYENNAYDLQNELRNNYPNLNLKVLIASVRDRKRLDSIFNEYKPNIVFHAAAHKHVPLMEDNPSEAIKNNVFGTLNVSEAANKYKTERFVLISTDKAVNPTNIMGASKRICEMIIQAMDKQSSTEFVAVRFGNVLGSNGSVIPLFKKQIINGGPITLTHKDITRFFMTIPEAAQLVLQAGSYAKGGEIFVLDMGDPVKIYDLAYDLIKLSGFEPGVDIGIKVIGLRPGEKLYEELLMEEEGLGNTAHEKIFVGKPISIEMNRLRASFNKMEFIIEEGSYEELINEIQKLVVTYKRKEKREIAIDEDVEDRDFLKNKGKVTGKINYKLENT